MFKALSYREKVVLLKELLKKPSQVRKEQVQELLSLYPFEAEEGEENLNYLSLKLFRLVRDKVDVGLLAQKLSVAHEETSEVLQGEGFEVRFPISDGKKALMAKALVIPLRSQGGFSTEPLSDTSLKVLTDLSGKGFFLSVSHGFDFETSSYMLAVYSALRFGKTAESYAFTGSLSSQGRIEKAHNLEIKLKKAEEEGIPLVFPDACMKEIKDLETFIEDLRIPLAVLPPKDPLPPAESFKLPLPFSPDYLRKVFHIKEELIYTKPFNNTAESFMEFVDWLNRVVNRLSALKSEGIRFSVAVASKVVPMSFVTGVKLSKGRLPCVYYEWRNEEGYKESFSIKDEHTFRTGERVKELVKVHEPRGEIKEVVVRTKSMVSSSDNTLLISLPSGEELSRRVVEVAGYVQSIIRGKPFVCADMKMEAPNSFSFALGYMLEDYKCLILNHFTGGKYVPLFKVAGGDNAPLFLANAFSLNMLQKGDAFLRISKVGEEQARKLVRETPFVSYISHQSTAQVLTELLGVNVEYRRENLKLPNRSRALVFQLRKRPPEGGVYSQEELKEILEEGLYSFYLVEVFY